MYTLDGEQGVNDYLKNMDGDLEGSAYHYIKIHKEESVVEPYLFSLNGKKEQEQLVTSFCVPILKSGTFIGLSGADIGLDRYNTIISKIKPFEESHSILITNEGAIVSHPDSSLINKKIQTVFPELESSYSLSKQIKEGKSLAFTLKDKTGTASYYSFYPIQIGASTTPWSLVTIKSVSSIFRSANRIANRTIIMGILGFLLIGFGTWYTIHKLINTLHQFTNFANKVNNGDLTATLAFDKENEIGQLADALRRMAQSLREFVNQIKASSESIADASSLLNENSQSISHSSSIQAAEVEEISAALEQILAFIEQTAEHSKQTEAIALQTRQSIEESNSASAKANQSIHEITSKNQVITDIALQTNILALNAAVEAARAGDHGRGFSVVADEVRKLAEQSKQAAEEIKLLSAVMLSDATLAGKKLEEVVPEVDKTHSLVKNISQVSFEQSVGVRQISHSIRELNDLTQTHASGAESLAASSEELSSQAQQLMELISTFKS